MNRSCCKVGQVLQSGTEVVTKCDRCYKVRRMLLQSGTGVTKCDDCYKVGSNRYNAKELNITSNLSCTLVLNMFVCLFV